jgi:hypothetical protein
VLPPFLLLVFIFPPCRYWGWSITYQAMNEVSPTSPSTVFWLGATQDCVHPYCLRSVCDDVISRIQATAADISGQLFFVRGSILRHCEACVQAEGWHVEQLSLYSTGPTTRTGSTRKRVAILRWRLKVSQMAEFGVFDCSKGIYWHFMLKLIVSTL